MWNSWTTGIDQAARTPATASPRQLNGSEAHTATALLTAAARIFAGRTPKPYLPIA
ncbi:hypothetical protein [Nocardia vaccinii]|uniref:hypothetical protein n=1 Tax=Nocardia vaccinii TaxID=1822 RepID=UPI00403AA64F